MFFQDWFTGAARETDDSFARVSRVLASDFLLVSPRGELYDRTGILEIIRAAYNRRTSGFRVWIEDVTVRLIAEPLCIATYEEWQAEGSNRTRRFSSVVFRRAPDLPNGVQWVHLHETWLAIP
jgi:hypothetical protein